MNRTTKGLISAIALLVLVSAAPPAPPLGQTYHVATTGSNSNPGTSSKPFRTVQRAVDAADPGDTILVHRGTYIGLVEIKKSGTTTRPIVLKSAGDGTAVLTKDFPKLSCSNSSPTRDRTIQLLAGADNWVIRDLTVINGILVSGSNVDALGRHVGDLSLPGRGPYDPAAAEALLPLLKSDAADNVKIINTRVRNRGIHVTAARYGEIVDNEVFEIDCGVGAAIYLSRFSDKWVIRGNYVHHNEPSREHPMEEGIRMGSGSNYNLITDNLTEDLSGRGRGFAADTHASWNTFSDNLARRTYMGFNEQTGGWGNRWIENRAVSTRAAGFSVDGKDGWKTRPDIGVPAFPLFRRNCSLNNPEDLNIGAVQAAIFESNGMKVIDLSDNVRSYWQREGNLWNGGSRPPDSREPGERWC